MKINDDKIVAISHQEEGCFTHKGCDNCDNGFGNTTFKVKAHIEGFKDFYDIELCHSCLCAYYNGEAFDKDCKNKYQM